MDSSSSEIATFGGGCFWCTEAVFKRLKGVLSVISGYAGGTMENPSYGDVSSETTQHAEAVQVIFDPTIISYKKLLGVFWATHDPTTKNRQGNDIGSQYRSIIFYHALEQKRIAEESRDSLEKSGHYKNSIVTEIIPFTNFYKAEDYHQNYYERNRDLNPYCPIVIDPKIEKLIKEFNGDIKEEYKKTL